MRSLVALYSWRSIYVHKKANNVVFSCFLFELQRLKHSIRRKQILLFVCISMLFVVVAALLNLSIYVSLIRFVDLAASFYLSVFNLCSVQVSHTNHHFNHYHHDTIRTRRHQLIQSKLYTFQCIYLLAVAYYELQICAIVWKFVYISVFSVCSSLACTLPRIITS